MILFSFDYPPNDGGIARLCAAIATELTSRGMPVQVLSQQFNNGAEIVIDKHIETTRLNPVRPKREVAALNALRAKKDATTCISGIWYPEGLLAYFGKFEKRVILAHSAELYPPTQSWRRPLWKYLQKYILEQADVVIANSNFTADLVKEAAPNARVIAVPLAVDHHQFCPQNPNEARLKWNVGKDKLVLCTISRIHRFKGHETVLKALASLPADIRQKFEYLIGGKGSDTAYLQEQAKKLGIEDQVRWLGFVADDDLPSLYSASDLFVLATREIPGKRSVEGFGLAFLEAQACGTPVVGTNTGGIPDAVSHGDGGWLIEEDNSDELANILTDLYNNPKKFRVAGDKARDRVEREFTWAHYLDRFISALETKGITVDGK